MNIIRINDDGLRQIAAALAEHHKLGESMTPDMIHAWATEAEHSWYEHGLCRFEISDMDARLRAPVIVDVSGYDVETVED